MFLKRMSETDDFGIKKITKFYKITNKKVSGHSKRFPFCSSKKLTLYFTLQTQTLVFPPSPLVDIFAKNYS